MSSYIRITEVRHIDGQWGAAIPILDTRISIPMERRTALEMITLIGEGVSLRTGIKGGLMTGPLNGLANISGTWGAKDEAARSVLQRVLSDVHLRTGSILGWVVGYVPAPEAFGLNITAVPQLSSSSVAVPAAPAGTAGIAIGGQRAK